MSNISRRNLLGMGIGTVAAAGLAPFALCGEAHAATPLGSSPAPSSASAYEASIEKNTSTLIKNAQIFDGISSELHQGNLLIVGSKIRQISPMSLNTSSKTRVIDAAGRVLMPGLTDAHWHMTMAEAHFKISTRQIPG